jgi:hypothetical protein
LNTKKPPLPQHLVQAESPELPLQMPSPGQKKTSQRRTPHRQNHDDDSEAGTPTKTQKITDDKMSDALQKLAVAQDTLATSIRERHSRGRQLDESIRAFKEAFTFKMSVGYRVQSI